MTRTESYGGAECSYCRERTQRSRSLSVFVVVVRDCNLLTHARSNAVLLTHRRLRANLPNLLSKFNTARMPKSFNRFLTGIQYYLATTCCLHRSIPSYRMYSAHRCLLSARVRSTGFQYDSRPDFPLDHLNSQRRVYSPTTDADADADADASYFHNFSRTESICALRSSRCPPTTIIADLGHVFYFICAFHSSRDITIISTVYRRLHSSRTLST